MSKVRIAVVLGVAAVYPFGQQHPSKTMKRGQTIDLEIGPDAEPKMSNLAATLGILGVAFDAIKADLGAPAAGVATDEPFGDRDGTVAIEAVDGPVTVRHYEGSTFAEHVLAESDRYEGKITESNKITLAVYPAKAEPK